MMFLTFIREVPASNLGKDIGFTYLILADSLRALADISTEYLPNTCQKQQHLSKFLCRLKDRNERDI